MAQGPSRYWPMLCKAFTLWELLCALAVAGVTLTFGAPGLRDVLLNARRTATVDALVAAVQLARSEAAKRGATIVLCQSADGRTCAPDADYSSGWIVFVDEDGDAPAQRRATEPLLRAAEPAMLGAIVANRNAFEFRPFQVRSTNGTLTLCGRRDARHARAIVVSYTGRPRVTGVSAAQHERRCT
jgi:type IV fimbrial biogenesis protein FimT